MLTSMPTADVHSSPDSVEGITLPDTARTAYHEAGHVVAAELLHPGTVTLAYIRKGYAGTFGKTCYYLPAVENCYMSAYSAPMVQPNRPIWCTATAEMVHLFHIGGAW